MTPAQRREAVEYRRLRERPWHLPPHWEFVGLLQFMISGACYEHKHVIGVTPERIAECESALLDACEQFATNVYSWCVLPNHYHLLVQTDRLKELRASLGKFHGRTSFKWNGEDNRRGRQVWHNCLDRGIKSHSHFWASVNYFTTIQCITATWRNGRTGRGRARRLSLIAWVTRPPQRFGASIPFWTVVRSGTLISGAYCQLVGLLFAKKEPD